MSPATDITRGRQRITRRLRCLLGALLVGVITLPAAAAEKKPPAPAAPATEDVAALVGRYGTILGKEPAGVGGLTAWTVSKNGQRMVLYTTPPSDQPVAVMAGILWDARTGRNISDDLVKHSAALKETPPSVASLFTPPLRPVPAMDGTYTGDIPESMKTVESLAGVKEGKGAVGDRVFIVVDPRCPYCQETYRKTRKHVAAGASITWIPVLALGDADKGLPLAASLLQSKDAGILGKVLGEKAAVKTEASAATIEELRRSLAFLFAAFEQNGSGKAGVPAAFFLDHRTGKPRMLTGLSEDAVLEDIFGAIH
ncbi:hypothetical protein [Tahibacter amnicola]|uniref:Thiol:disulfide interchange protein DsbG n=1 Tax=Tahibacter amnicola TaxID=2976241 RepID=A0ABY6BE88_9GAMM|nr:hypothetical protein [Tahibacter amnicola]UXI68344.1 hypothetical protein N4264_01450 [Tahibacter amnicola]